MSEERPIYNPSAEVPIPASNNYYMVKLKLIIGEQEKNTRHLIRANSKEQATLQAMADESHGAAELTPDGVWLDLHGQMSYTLISCKLLPLELVESLVENGLFVVSQFDKVAIKSMLSEPQDVLTLCSYLLS